MKTMYQNLREFHTKMGLPVSDTPHILSMEEYRLFAANIREEVKEMMSELDIHRGFAGAPEDLQTEHLVALAKEMNDVKYVIEGFMVACGIDGDKTGERVHESNMRKQPGNTNELGKILKPPGWVKPDLTDLCKVEGVAV